ncbi:thiamine-phosphate kinase [soil metagenome]
MNEFQFIDRLRSMHSLDRIGDDCAVMPSGKDKDLLLTADMLVENVDFRMEWTTPEFLGHKALAVSLSDIAAMGGAAFWSMLSIGVPEDLWNSDFLDRFYDGWFALALKFDVELVGGDISRVPQDLVIDSVVGGDVPIGKAILRSTARPGDAIFVSGTLGGAAGALKLLEKGIRYDTDLPVDMADLLLKQLQPQPELYVANSLQQLHIATSAIDLSDGLSSDLGHICRESGVGADVHADKLPIDPALSHHFSDDECLRLAVHGGEDFRLLFTADQENIYELENIGAFHVGTLTANANKIELIDGENTTPLAHGGYRHF